MKNAESIILNNGYVEKVKCYVSPDWDEYIVVFMNHQVKDKCHHCGSNIKKYVYKNYLLPGEVIAQSVCDIGSHLGKRIKFNKMPEKFRNDVLNHGVLYIAPKGLGG